LPIDSFSDIEHGSPARAGSPHVRNCHRASPRLIE
jgi:hypothetical protein